jgi:hypothetical protein
MASLKPMPPISFDTNGLKTWGTYWLGTIGSNDSIKSPNRFDKKQSMDFGKMVIDPAFAKGFAAMLGGIPIVEPLNNRSLLPPSPDCIEIGDTRVIGGVRPQNFDIAYRPDGLRIAYDSKTLNDFDSIKKNWQNMINDLATEATTVHTRFPYAIVCFVVVIPKPALDTSQEYDITRTLERLATRRGVQNQNHLAEAITFLLWDPATGMIDPSLPAAGSILRIERFPEFVYTSYVERYKGLPPHDKT